MKNLRKSIGLVTLAIFVMTLVSSCTKWRENREYFTLQDHNAVEDTYHDLFRLTCQEGDASSSLLIDTTYTVSVSGTTYPKTVTLTFVSSSPDVYGQKRKGSVTIAFSQNFSTAGAVATITPSSEFANNNYKVTGVMTVTNKGSNSSGYLVYDLEVPQANATTPQGANFTWTCSHNMKLFNAHQPLIFDDVYHITGTANGVDHEGFTYTVNINDSLEKEQDCRWPRSGKLTMTILSLDDKEVDYASNTCTDTQAACCDNQVDVKTGGKREEQLKLE